MTDADRTLLDANLKNFDSFIEFHAFLFSHDIEFTQTEWEEYRDRFFQLVRVRRSSSSVIDVDVGNIIMPT